MKDGGGDTRRKTADAGVDSALRAPPGPERDDAAPRRYQANPVPHEPLGKGTSSNPIDTGGLRDD